MPFFSVLLFTKNRAELASFALQSILNQSFTDFEVVVSDNDDTGATSFALSRFKDCRVRYHRSGGGLSINENWEKSFSLSKGEYILSLTDRAVLRPKALKQIREAISRHCEEVYVWPYVLYDSRKSFDRFIIPAREADKTVLSSEIFELFRKKAYCGYTDLLPKSLNSCHSRAIINAIRNTTGGTICLPVCPDHNIGFLTLAHCERVVALGEPQFVWGGLQFSNGGGTYRGSETFKRYLSDLGITEEFLYSEVPVKAIGIHNMVCNDFLRLKALYPKHFARFELDLPSYFLNCYDEPSLWLERHEPLFRQNRKKWEHALSNQPQSIQDAVSNALGKRRRHLGVFTRLRMWAKIGTRIKQLLPEPVSNWKRGSDCDGVGRTGRTTVPRPKKFQNIIEALNWIERSMAGEGSHTS